MGRNDQLQQIEKRNKKLGSERGRGGIKGGQPTEHRTVQKPTRLEEEEKGGK